MVSRSYLLPKEDVDIKEGSWDAMGLRGTASIDHSITDKFVPAHRTFEYPFLAGENPQNPCAQGLVYDGQPGLVAFASGITKVVAGTRNHRQFTISVLI
jgi:hypothetical protein